MASWLFSRDQMDYWQTNNRFQLIHNKNLLKWLTVTTGPMLGAGYIFWEKMVFLTNVPVTLSDLDCVMCQHYPPANSLLLDCNSGKCQLGVMWTFQVLNCRTDRILPFLSKCWNSSEGTEDCRTQIDVTTSAIRMDGCSRKCIFFISTYINYF